MIAQNDTVIGQKELVPVFEEGADVDLCIKDIAPVSDDRARSRRSRPTSIDKMDCHAVALPPLSGGPQKETITLDGLVVVVLGSVKNESEFHCPLLGQPFPLGDIRHLLR